MTGVAVNTIKSFNDVVIFYNYTLSEKLHANHSLKVLVAGKAFTISHDRRVIRTKGAIVRSDTLHEVNVSDGWLISIFIDPQCLIGNAINSLNKKSRVVKIEDSISIKLFKFFYNALHSHLAEADIKDRLERNLLGLDTSSIELALDKRIEQVIQYIRSRPDARLADLLNICGLSESRLLHLFKKETGTTIRRYILWSRIQKAIRLMAFGSPLKQSAKQSGFTDAAHFSRTFVAMHGIAPSLMRQ